MNTNRLSSEQIGALITANQQIHDKFVNANRHIGLNHFYCDTPFVFEGKRYFYGMACGDNYLLGYEMIVISKGSEMIAADVSQPHTYSIWNRS